MAAQHPELTPEAIFDYIDRHYAENITPRVVADALSYSLSHLTHLARRRLGASVSELIRRRRIVAARHLLEHTAEPIAHIAASVGFSDLAYFSRRFSQVMGASPSRWRKTHRLVPLAARCHTCGGTLPSVPLAQDDAADVRAAAS